MAGESWIGDLLRVRPDRYTRDGQCHLTTGPIEDRAPIGSELMGGAALIHGLLGEIGRLHDLDLEELDR